MTFFIWNAITEINKEFVRLIHNYVASAKSLVDHTRKLYQELHEPNNLFPEYQDKVNTEFVDSPIIRFVQDLRNYCLHYRLPQIQSQLSINQVQGSSKSTIFLIKSDLLDFNWSSKAKKYINEHEEKLEVKVFVDEYYGKVVNFYQWYTNRVRLVHQKEHSAIQIKIKEIQKEVLKDLPRRLNITLGILESERLGKPDDLFISFFGSRIWEEIVEAHPEPVARAEHAINLIQQETVLDVDLISRIRKVYSEWYSQ